MVRLRDLAEAAQGRMVRGDPELQIGPAEIDTRRLRPGWVFFALKGERADGHDFLPQAAEAGASCAVVRAGFQVPGGLGEMALLEVRDPEKALWAYGELCRSRFEGTVVGVTGSNGKTTTKEMLAAAARRALGPDQVVWNQGSWNNHLGVPLTLSRLSSQAFAVLEMGMNHPGEIAALARLAEPEVGVVTSVGRAHLEGLGDLEAVARAKGELLDSLPDSGAAIIPAGFSALERASRHLDPTRVWVLGGQGPNGLRVLELRREGPSRSHVAVETPRGRLSFSLPLAGAHNAQNAAAAAGAALLAGLDPEAICEGLSSFEPAPHRSVLTRIGGALVLDDCYNANPTSMSAALKTLSELGGRLGAVLGDMAELGPKALELHQEVLHEAARRGLEVLVVTGPLMTQAARELGHELATIEVVEAETARRAGQAAAGLFGPGWSVLVKGSRVSGLEEALESWRQAVEAAS